MTVSIEEVKLYLRVDGDAENALINGFVKSAEEICENVLRFPLSDFATVPDIVKQAIFYITSNMYEKREDVDMKEVINVVKIFLSPLRKEKW